MLPADLRGRGPTGPAGPVAARVRRPGHGQPDPGRAGQQRGPAHPHPRCGHRGGPAGRAVGRGGDPGRLGPADRVPAGLRPGRRDRSGLRGAGLRTVLAGARTATPAPASGSGCTWSAGWSSASTAGCRCARGRAAARWPRCACPGPTRSSGRPCRPASPPPGRRRPPGRIPHSKRRAPRPGHRLSRREQAPETTAGQRCAGAGAQGPRRLRRPPVRRACRARPTGSRCGSSSRRPPRTLRLLPEYTEKYGEREVTLATVLPLAWPALTKPDGRIFLGLQRGTQSGDVNRDLALSLLLALEAPPGGPVAVPPLPGPGSATGRRDRARPARGDRAGRLRLLAGRGVDRPGGAARPSSGPTRRSFRRYGWRPRRPRTGAASRRRRTCAGCSPTTRTRRWPRCPACPRRAS